MKRREFISLLGGAAAWPLAARAQQGERMRRVGVLMNAAADDPASRVRIVAFAQGLEQLGWTECRNVRIDTRWGENDVDRDRQYAALSQEPSADRFALRAKTLHAAPPPPHSALRGRLRRAARWGTKRIESTCRVV
jgi:hypothetical protein